MSLSGDEGSALSDIQKIQYHTFFHFTSSEWRRNFLGIKKLVLIGGPDDGVITPWQSRFVYHTSAPLLFSNEEITEFFLPQVECL